MSELLKNPLVQKLLIVLTAGIAVALSSKFPDFEKYVDYAAMFFAGGAMLRSPGDMKDVKAGK